MHVSMTNEIQMGMNKMKFALNHKWKFARWRFAYMAGLFQVIICLLVAIISYFVIVFDDTIIDIVKDFLALQVVSEFDDYFFIEYVESKEICKQFVKNEDYHKILEIQTTTSSDVQTNEQSNIDRFVHDGATNWVNFMRK